MAITNQYVTGAQVKNDRVHPFRKNFDELEIELLDIKAQDDAKDYQWIPLHELRKQTMFLDHYDIIQDLMKEVL